MSKILSVLAFLFLTIPTIGIAQQKENVVNNTTVVLETNQGNVEIKLFPEIAPKTCENFVGLVKKGYYNGLIFHRTIKNFMIQGGDPTGSGGGGESLWGGKFEDEFNDKVQFDRKGLLAMANAGPNTNGSQFFIMLEDNPTLPPNYTIFGKVTSGQEVVNQIKVGDIMQKVTIETLK